MSQCNTSGLNVYVPSSDMPWTERRVKHLYHRAGHGATYAMVQEGLAMTPEELVDKLVDDAMAISPVEDPGWGYADRPTLGANFPGFRQNFKVMQEWFYDCLLYTSPSPRDA